MRKLPPERGVWPTPLYRSDRDLELELLRRIVVKLETLSFFKGDQGEMLEMHRLLLLLEVRAQQASLKRASVQEEEVSSVDWARLLPLLLAAGVVLGVIVAQLLGLDMRHVL